MAKRGRPPKIRNYDADAETIRDAFARRREVLAGAKAARSEFKADLERVGVHAPTLALVDRLASLPPGRRGWTVALLRRYLDCMAAELADPQAPEPGIGHNSDQAPEPEPVVEEESVEVSCSRPQPTPQQVWHGGFDQAESAAIAAANVTRTEQGEWPDVDRAELSPGMRRAAARGGGRPRRSTRL